MRVGLGLVLGFIEDCFRVIEGWFKVSVVFVFGFIEGRFRVGLGVT